MTDDDLDDEEEHGERELAIMVYPGHALGPCAFCHVDPTPEELGVLELFVAGGRGWVCHECGHERSPLLARLLDLARAAEDYAFEVQGPQDGDEIGEVDDEGTIH
jgi:hypothetical protein